MAGPLPELEPLLLARFGAGNWRVQAWDIEPIRYLPSERATLQLTAQAQDATTGRTERRRFYAKVYHDEAGKRTHQVLQLLWHRASADGEGFTVGRPVAYLDSLQTLIQEEADGVSFEDILFQQEDEATLAARKVARALATLHLSQIDTPQLRRLQDESSNLEYIEKLLRQACPHLMPEVEEIIVTVTAGLEEVPPAPTHGDLSLEHILIDDDHLALIDLDSFARGDPVVDAAQVLAYLAALPLRSPLSHGRAQIVARVFAEEYFSRVPEVWRSRLSVQYAGAILEVAAGFFNSQEPGWPAKIEALTEEAKDSLAGKVW